MLLIKRKSVQNFLKETNLSPGAKENDFTAPSEPPTPRGEESPTPSHCTPKHDSAPTSIGRLLFI